MSESQRLMKKKQTGREKDIKAIDRIKNKITTEKTEIERGLDQGIKEPNYEDMTKPDLEDYKQDLIKRLMYFEAEANDIRTEIKKIITIQAN